MAYQPVSRDLYEELEMRAAFRQPCRLVYRAANGGTVSLQTRISALLREPEGEFLVTEEGLRLRLDQLLGLDDQEMQHWA